MSKRLFELTEQLASKQIDQDAQAFITRENIERLHTTSKKSVHLTQRSLNETEYFDVFEDGPKCANNLPTLRS